MGIGIGDNTYKWVDNWAGTSDSNDATDVNSSWSTGVVAYGQ